MKKIFLYISILILPVLLLIGVNEFTRKTTTKNKYKKYNIVTVNSGKYNTNKCTWACHNNTDFCKKHHVKLLKSHYKYTDGIYFGIIHSLKSTGNYQLANIIFLVIIIPLALYFFIIKSIQIQYKINRYKKL